MVEILLYVKVSSFERMVRNQNGYVVRLMSRTGTIPLISKSRTSRALKCDLK